MTRQNPKRLLPIAAWVAALSLVACGPPNAYVGGGNGSQGNTSTGGGTTGNSGGGASPDGGNAGGGNTGGGTGDAGQTAPACQPGAWSSIALPFFNSYCTGCHSYFSNLSTVQQQAGTISSYIQGQMMPPSYAQQPSDTERQTILQWLACGAPQ